MDTQHLGERAKGRKMSRQPVRGQCNPPHPGEVLRDGVFADKGLTGSDFAKRLGVTRVTLSRVLQGRAAISADMAVRLAAALGGSAESWLHMQANWDLWRARRALRTKVTKIARVDDVAA